MGKKVCKPTLGTSKHGKFGMLQLMFFFLPAKKYLYQLLPSDHFDHPNGGQSRFTPEKVTQNTRKGPNRKNLVYLRYQSKKGRKSTEDAIRFHEEVQETVEKKTTTIFARVFFLQTVRLKINGLGRDRIELLKKIPPGCEGTKPSGEG